MWPKYGSNNYSRHTLKALWSIPPLINNFRFKYQPFANPNVQNMIEKKLVNGSQHIALKVCIAGIYYIFFSLNLFVKIYLWVTVIDLAILVMYFILKTCFKIICVSLVDCLYFNHIFFIYFVSRVSIWLSSF